MAHVSFRALLVLLFATLPLVAADTPLPRSQKSASCRTWNSIF